MQSKRTISLAIGALLVAGLIGYAQTADSHWLSVVIVIIMGACLALTWNLASGYGGVFSLGHHVFFGIGAYTSTMLLLKANVSPWIGIFAAGLLAAAVGTVIALVTFRLRLSGVFFGLLTLSLGEVARSVSSSWEWIGGTTGLFVPLKDEPKNFLFLDRMPYFYVALGLLVLFLLITWLVDQSKLGYYLKAIREDENAAEASGIDTYRYKTLIMALSAGLAGVMGTFYAQFFQFIEPNVVFRFDLQMDMMLGVMVGGPGTLLGPLFGTGIFGFLGEFLRGSAATTQMASLSKVIYAIVLMFVALYLPTGLVGLPVGKLVKAVLSAVKGGQKHAA